LLKKGFYQENLDQLVACCSGLAQDSSYVLPFFVLKNLFAEMSSLLELGPTPPSQHTDLVSDLAEPIDLMLEKIANNQDISFADLDLIVRTHLRNASVFRSGQP
jgi:hypothetical protein